ncbi:hypothetical protein ACFQX4_16530 [Roseomonas sp. GCM10028921]
MRLALLMSHADRSMAGAMRDMRFLARAGAEIAVFRLHPGPEVMRESCLRGEVSVTFAPSDKIPGRSRTGRSRRRSSGLSGTSPRTRS